MNTPFLGMIQYYAFDFAPRGWAACNGSLLAINQNQALFSLLGTQYGGNGQTTFALPDYRGRAITGVGNGSNMGQPAGAENALLQLNNLPAHTHTVTQTAQLGANSTAGTAPSPARAYPSEPSDRTNLYAAA